MNKDVRSEGIKLKTNTLELTLKCNGTRNLKIDYFLQRNLLVDQIGKIMGRRISIGVLKPEVTTH